VADAVERLVNLALYLADAAAPVPHARIRAEVAGYPAEQDDAAFARMFERDKDLLRDAGFAIEVDERGNYWLDREATFAASVEFSAEEAAAIQAAGSALVDDPSFPFAADLRLALAKVSSGKAEGGVPAVARLADEDAERQGETAALLSAASAARKRVTFGYTNSLGVFAPHEVEPYGLFLHDGRWYLVGRDTGLDQTRTYAVARMRDASANAVRPKAPDFERPADFDVRTFVRLPFQYGPPAEEFEATVFFDASAAWRAEAVTGGEGRLRPDGNEFAWHIRARSPERLVRFVLENGPGLRLVAPTSLATLERAGLEAVIRAHE